MPVEGFICPDGKRLKKEECYAKCRMDKRCATKSWLESIGYDRAWRGITASMAGQGIRMIYLRKNFPYYITPDSRAFAMLSVVGLHSRMAKADFNRLTEERLEEGTADCLEEDEDNKDKYILTDLKSWGSYKLSNALFTKNIMNELMPETFQLNAYRIGFEKNGFPISKIQLFCIARDGGTFWAKKRGLDRSTYLIELPRLDDEIVIKRYDDMKREFAEAEKNNYAPMCSLEETWKGARCKSFCDVSELCVQMGGHRNANSNVEGIKI